MKKLSLIIAAVMLSAGASVVSAKSTSKLPFEASTYRLGEYLDLSYDQADKLEGINEYFIEMQQKSLRSRTPESEEALMHQAVFGNLKLLKGVLSHEQYRKYLILLNITNNNNHIIGHVFPVDNHLIVNGK